MGHGHGLHDVPIHFFVTLRPFADPCMPLKWTTTAGTRTAEQVPCAGVYKTSHEAQSTAGGGGGRQNREDMTNDTNGTYLTSSILAP
jgi:hypothetical protein